MLLCLFSLHNISQFCKSFTKLTRHIWHMSYNKSFTKLTRHIWHMSYNISTSSSYDPAFLQGIPTCFHLIYKIYSCFYFNSNSWQLSWYTIRFIHTSIINICTVYVLYTNMKSMCRNLFSNIVATNNTLIFVCSVSEVYVVVVLTYILLFENVYRI